MIHRRLLLANLALGVGIPAAAGYSANAVDFDGTNDYLTRGADLTGNADGKKGIFSAWVKLNGGDGVAQVLYEGGAQALKPVIFRGSDDKFEVNGRRSNNVLTLRFNSVNTYVADATWRHILMSWDLAVPGSGRLRVDDVSDYNEITFDDFEIDYSMASPDHAVGGRVNGTLKLNGCLADLYWNPAEYLDLDVVANVRKFIDAAGKPVDLGADGSAPTGTAPIVFQTGPTSTWHTNAGGGGGFTENGTLGDCSDGP